MAAAAPGPGPLERAAALLAQRDGTDKALKAVRYGARLALALQGAGHGGETQAQLRRLDRALGQSRKALRWGKFLGPVAELRRALVAAQEKKELSSSSPLYRLTDPAGGLAAAALAAEACYLFLDQAQFLVKAGLWRPSRRQRQVEVAAAAFEVLHLAASLGAAAVRLRALREREARLVLRLHGLLAKRREAQAGAGGEARDFPRLPQPLATAGLDRRQLPASRNPPTAPEAVLRGLQRDLQREKTRIFVASLQDALDAVLALNDLRQRDRGLGHPTLLASCGLASACCGTWKLLK